MLLKLWCLTFLYDFIWLIIGYLIIFALHLLFCSFNDLYSFFFSWYWKVPSQYRSVTCAGCFCALPWWAAPGVPCVLIHSGNQLLHGGLGAPLQLCWVHWPELNNSALMAWRHYCTVHCEVCIGLLGSCTLSSGQRWCFSGCSRVALFQMFMIYVLVQKP